MSNWTLFSNHGHVLVCLARDPEARLRDVAADVGITERAVQKIVRDLQDGGMISVTKNGRRNCYRIHKKQALRHKLEAGCKLNDLLKVLNRASEPEPAGVSRSAKPGQAVGQPPGQSEIKEKSGVITEVKTRPIQSGPPDPVPEKSGVGAKTGTGKSRSPETPEKQQGSLF